MIRITAGRLKGRKIHSPGNDKIRPTTGLVRESLFNQLQGNIGNCRFLDLFAGSGLMGFEALSRGANYVLAVEKNPAHARLIKQNIDGLSLEPTAYQLRKQTAELALKHPEDKPFDIVFMDPPYGYSNITAVLSGLSTTQWITEDAIILVEQASEDPPLAIEADIKQYGNTRVSKLLGCQLLKT